MSIPARAQFFAEKAYNLLHDSCPDGNPASVVQLVDIEQDRCKYANRIAVRTEIIKKNFAEVSENAYLSELAEERAKSLRCVGDQIQNLQDHPDERDEFIQDFSEKLVLLGHEKRKIIEFRSKVNKTKEDIEEYEKSVARAKMILESLPFSEINSFQRIIHYSISEYESKSPDRLNSWFPDQLNRMLKRALPEALEDVRRNKRTMNDAVTTLGTSLDDVARESLAQDTDLVEYVRARHKDSEKEIKPVACRIDAKFGKGAQYRDHALLAGSVIGTGAAGLMARAGTAALTSSITGMAAAGNISLRSAGILRILAEAGATTTSILQINRSCFAKESDLTGVKKKGERVCEKNILKSRNTTNCVLAGAMGAVGLGMTGYSAKTIVQELKGGANAATAAKKATGSGKGD